MLTAVIGTQAEALAADEYTYTLYRVCDGEYQPVKLSYRDSVYYEDPCGAETFSTQNGFADIIVQGEGMYCLVQMSAPDDHGYDENCLTPETAKQYSLSLNQTLDVYVYMPMANIVLSAPQAENDAITVNVTNAGNGYLKDVSVTLFVDGRNIGEENYSLLAPDSQITAMAELKTILAPGVHTVTAESCAGNSTKQTEKTLFQIQP